MTYSQTLNGCKAIEFLNLNFVALMEQAISGPNLVSRNGDGG